MTAEPRMNSPHVPIVQELLEVKRIWPGGISYAEIARRAGISKAHTIRLFQFKGNPSVGTLTAVARALDRSLAFELLEQPPLDQAGKS